jgi:hypothetical protein
MATIFSRMTRQMIDLGMNGSNQTEGSQRHVSLIKASPGAMLSRPVFRSQLYPQLIDAAKAR